MNVGIVSTHRRWTARSEAWARYHLGLGFSRIYVFIDDGKITSWPSSCAVSLAACTPQYWAMHRSRHWHAEPYLQDILRDIGTPSWGSPERVMQRQTLNASLAMDIAAGDGIDWLLHIDDDECFWCPGTTVPEHFDSLQRAGMGIAVYWNHETVLPRTGAAGNGRRRTLFKKNWNVLTSLQREIASNALNGKPYFASYSNGKSAARVVPGTLPNGVHEFYASDAMLGHATTGLPCILHRPYESVVQFCSKHMSQGTWSTERVFGAAWTPPGVYAQAQHRVRESDIQGLRSLYEQSLTLKDDELQALLTQGLILAPELVLPFDEVAAEPEGVPRRDHVSTLRAA